MTRTNAFAYATVSTKKISRHRLLMRRTARYWQVRVVRLLTNLVNFAPFSKQVLDAFAGSMSFVWNCGYRFLPSAERGQGAS
jgi:hypothetical protein